MRRLDLGPVLVALLFALPATPVLAAKGDCGQPSSTGTSPKAADALYVLKRAVGLVACELCVCDVNNSNTVTAADALKVLKKAVGIAQVLTCPACVPSLTGTVTAPTVSRPGAAPAPAQQGWSPVAGATVQLVNLDTKGNAPSPALATAVTDASGNYRITPRPTPGSQVMVRTQVDGETLRAFVTGPTADMNPAQEFLAATAISSIQASEPATLATLSVGEIADLSLWLSQAPLNPSAYGTVADAVTAIEQDTAGVVAARIRDFALGSGPAAPFTGSFHLLQTGSRLTNSSTKSTLEASGAVQGKEQNYGMRSRMVVASDGSVADAATAGGTQSITEDHVTTKLGPAELSGNATVAYSSGATSGTLGSGVSLRASDHGALLMRLNDDVPLASMGVFASGSATGIAATNWAAPSTRSAVTGANFVIREGSGLTNASLSGTYSFVTLSAELGREATAESIPRSSEVRIANGAFSFSNGVVSYAGPLPTDDLVLQKNAPPPGSPASLPTLALKSFAISQPGVSGYTYELAANGALTILYGGQPEQYGAVSPDLNMLVLVSLGEYDSPSLTQANARVTVGVKQGSGMNTASGKGIYNFVELAAQRAFRSATGSPEQERDYLSSTIGMRAGHSSFSLDGAGTVNVGAGFSVDTSQLYAQEALRYLSGPPTVYAPSYATIGRLLADTSDTNSFPYEIASDGTVSIGGGTLTGYLSANGSVFLLPQFSADPGSGRGEATLLVGMKAP